MKSILFLILVTTLLTEQVFAADIAADVRSGRSAPDNSNGGYFEIGMSAIYQVDPRIDGEDKDENDGLDLTVLMLGGGYRYKGFFVEVYQDTSDGVNLGYNFWNNQHWSVDILASSFIGSIDNEGAERTDDSLTEAQRNTAFTSIRTFYDTFYSGAGIRVTGYLDDYILQYRLVTDTHGGNGMISTARLGKSLQVKNWNFHGIVSAQYTSATTNRYWFGISAEQATTHFPEHDPGASVSFSTEIGVTYPLSKDWVFRSFGRYALLPDEVNDSPLTSQNYSALFVNSISYVF